MSSGSVAGVKFSMSAKTCTPTNHTIIVDTVGVLTGICFSTPLSSTEMSHAIDFICCCYKQEWKYRFCKALKQLRIRDNPKKKHRHPFIQIRDKPARNIYIETEFIEDHAVAVTKNNEGHYFMWISYSSHHMTLSTGDFYSDIRMHPVVKGQPLYLGTKKYILGEHGPSEGYLILQAHNSNDQ